jgi:hypothetical protein
VPADVAERAHGRAPFQVEEGSVSVHRLDGAHDVEQPVTTIRTQARGLVSVQEMPGQRTDVPRAVMDAWTERQILGGNAKSRRRWRRRNLPNRQRETLATCGNGHTMWRVWNPGDRCPACVPQRVVD